MPIFHVHSNKIILPHYDLVSHSRFFRVTVELARGTPHGRDRERWGDGRRGGRDDRGGDRRDR